MTDLQKDVHKIDMAQSAVDQLRVHFLNARGWSNTCDFPDCCWRWVKVFKHKGRNVTLTYGDAGNAVAAEARCEQ